LLASRRRTTVPTQPPYHGVVLSNGVATGPSGLALDRPFRPIEARPNQRKR
jgi:hypothetical protein